MTKYREILRLYSHGISKSGIAASCGCARKTVTKVLDRAKELNITWPLNQEMTGSSAITIKSSRKPKELACIFQENRVSRLKWTGLVKLLRLLTGILVKSSLPMYL